MIDKNMTEIVDKDQFAQHVGITLEDVKIGYAAAGMEIEQYHLNGAGNVQGGAIFTLADYTFAAACNAAGNLTSAISANVSFMRSPKGKRIRAVASEVSSTNRLCVYNVDIYDEDGSVFAKFVGTGYIKR